MSKSFKAALSLFLTLFLFSGCLFDEKDKPDTTKQDHFEAEGIVLIDSGIRFFKMFRGEADTTNGRVGNLISPVGLSAHWEIKFLDETGNEIDPPQDNNKSFGWVIGDPSMLEIYRHDNQEWEFHLNGIKEGATTIEFRVMHNDHYDFHTPAIPVQVIDTGDSHGSPVGVNLYDEETGELLASAPLSSAGTSKGEIIIPNGLETGHIEVVFYDSLNREFTPEAPEHSLELVPGDETILGYEAPVAPEYWAFHLKGLKNGETTLELRILHEGVTGLIFAPIKVKVNE